MPPPPSAMAPQPPKTITTTSSTHDVSKRDRHAKQHHHDTTTRCPHTTPCHDPNARRNDTKKTTTTGRKLGERDGTTKEGQKGQKNTEGATAGRTRYSHYSFSINSILITLLAPTTPENERDGSFSGGYDLSQVTTTTHHLCLATTTTHNPRKRAPPLVFGRFTSPWQLPPPTAPENERDGSFSGG